MLVKQLELKTIRHANRKIADDRLNEKEDDVHGWTQVKIWGKREADGKGNNDKATKQADKVMPRPTHKQSQKTSYRLGRTGAKQTREAV